MATRVTLHVRIVRPDGIRTYAAPVYAANRRLRGGYALVNGKPEPHPEACYYLRFPVEGKRVWRNVGANPLAAQNALVVQEHLTKGTSLGIASVEQLATSASPTPVQHSKPAVATKSERVSWTAAVREYLLEIESRRSKRTATLYRSALDEFAAASPATYLDEITRTHLLALEAYVLRKGNSPRTAYNHMVSVGTFLRHFGFGDVLKKRDLPRYTPKVPIAYSAEELRRLFAEASSEDRLLFEFFLGTGFREQEVMVATVRDVDFESGLIRVRAKPEYGFQPKDREEREVPVPDDLLAKLEAHVAAHPQQRLLFPNRRGQPQKHMIRRLKKTALKADLNCKECVSRAGQRCDEHPVCERWALHTFRRTMATYHHESGGVSIRVLADWLGHADPATSWGYLAVADKRSAATRRAVNNSFQALAF